MHTEGHQLVQDRLEVIVLVVRDYGVRSLLSRSLQELQHRQVQCHELVAAFANNLQEGEVQLQHARESEIGDLDVRERDIAEHFVLLIDDRHSANVMVPQHLKGVYCTRLRQLEQQSTEDSVDKNDAHDTH